ncbi:DUF4270 domain-containing protein [Chitinophaga sp. G-6-1-13]|uniref:DUF4270 domain-containing protein n=1 Tax=Chitinophaga fulva TaxID=2728842 RepID=A0A848H1B2_9BACT|nr:DUF4270 family protein [Chitinophaga fulva]NML41608.1 DUF4270 domain-containing protein [Chitinophaga fulva]
MNNDFFSRRGIKRMQRNIRHFVSRECAKQQSSIRNALLLLLLTGITACQKTGFSYDNVVDNQQTDYILTDTLSVAMKTILYDSVPTSGSGLLLVGTKSDPYLGAVTAGSYFQVIQPGGTDIPVNGSGFDSLRLILRPSGYIAGDSLQPQSLQVYRVTQTIQFAKTFYSLYNNSNFATENTPLGTFSGVIRPKTDKSVSIPLSNVLGNQLFTMLRDKSPDITAGPNFLDFFRGLKIVPGPGSTALMAFLAQDTSLTMRLYYHVNEIVTTVKYVDFKMNASELQFNQVTANRSGTPLEKLQVPVKELPSSATGNMSFTQSLTGVGTRIDLPYLKNMQQLGQFFKIMKVILTVYPAAGTFNGSSQIPTHLALCQVDKTNAVTDTIAYGNLTVDNLYNENTYYSYDITNYCNTQLTADNNGARGLFLTTPGGAGRNSFDRLVINDQQAPKKKIKVQVYYLLYK